MPATTAHKQLAADVARARDALLTAARTDLERWWRLPELKAAATNGWHDSAAVIAIRELIDEDELELDSQLRIRAVVRSKP